MPKCSALFIDVALNIDMDLFIDCQKDCTKYQFYTFYKNSR